MTYSRTIHPHSTIKTQGAHKKRGILHTKTSPPEIPGEIFKGFPTKQNSHQTTSPGCAEGLAKSLCGFKSQDSKRLPNLFKSHDLSKQILQILHTRILRVTRCTSIRMCRFSEELQIFLFNSLQLGRNSHINRKLSNRINSSLSILLLSHRIHILHTHCTSDLTILLSSAFLVIFHYDRKHHSACNTMRSIINSTQCMRHGMCDSKPYI